MEERNTERGTHTLSLERRKEAAFTGIKDVLAFDEQEVRFESDCGMITVKGEGLHIKQLTLENGEAKLEGKVNEILYADGSGFPKDGKSLLGRLFG